MHLSWQIVKTYSFEHWTSLIWSPHLLNFFQDWDKPPVESARFQSVGADRVTNRHYRRCPASTDERGSGIITASQYQTRVYDHKVFVFAKHLLGCGWWTQLGWQWRFFLQIITTKMLIIFIFWFGTNDVTEPRWPFLPLPGACLHFELFWLIPSASFEKFTAYMCFEFFYRVTYAICRKMIVSLNHPIFPQ